MGVLIISLVLEESYLILNFVVLNLDLDLQLYLAATAVDPDTVLQGEDSLYTYTSYYLYRATAADKDTKSF
jgi:hypothetical protein